MFPRLLTCLILACALLPSATAKPVESTGWVLDMTEGLELAQEEGKDILLDFTGSDWCHACVQLDKEVFSQPGFVEQARKNFVLIKLDFPDVGGETYRSMSRTQHERNARERDAFSVSLWPTIYLMTPEGVAYAKTGYRPGGSDNYVRHLNRLADDEMRTKAEKTVQGFFGSDSSDERRLKAAYSLLGRVPADVLEQAFAVIEELDPQDSQGVLAPRLLAAFSAEHLMGRTEDWDVPAAALVELGERYTSMQDQSLYHYYRTIIALNRDDLETARDGLDQMGRIGGVREDLVAMLEQWLERAEEEALQGDEQASEG